MKHYYPIRLFVADRQEVYLEGLSHILQTAPDIDLLGTTTDGNELTSALTILQPDILLTDPTFDIGDNTTVLQYVPKTLPNVNIIALSLLDDVPMLGSMLQAGVQGFLLRQCDRLEILEAIHDVYNRKPYYSRAIASQAMRLFSAPRSSMQREIFSVREKQIIQLICQDMVTKEIAARLDLSNRTVEGYRLRIMEKMNVRGTAGIVVYAIRQNMVEV
ncbi:LuxR family two component transcriptional regulator [Chitinophaga niastensis]|uniref:LuxR family two component transcriptional regulator n=1 Tax=Chitinophaga niastensis TaxID=536980 RepID=A0A2P8HDM7_CHINA|nr:response regulator transcription factor [Chitinophaga niastensis]PSL44241.1 LuxR family two component transcriptional regulator [Chitinophaga niastensis]